MRQQQQMHRVTSTPRLPGSAAAESSSFIASAAAPSSFFCVFTSLSALTRTANSLTTHTHTRTHYYTALSAAAAAEMLSTLFQ